MVAKRHIDAVRSILSELSRRRKVLIALVVLSIVSALSNSVAPYLAGRLVDSLIKGGEGFIIVLSIWISARITSDIVDWQINTKSENLETAVEADYVSRGFGKLLELPLSFHKKHKMGEIGNRISGASSQLGSILSRVVVDLSPQFLSIIFALGFTFYIQPSLSVILLTGLFVYAILVFKITPELGKIFHDMHKAYNKAYGDAYDAVLNVGAVKSAVAENYERRKVLQNFLRAAGLWNRVAGIWRKLNLFQRILISATQFLVFLISLFLIKGGGFTVGELVAFNGYAAMLFGPFTILGRNWQIIQNGLASISRAESILKTPAENYAPENAIMVPDIKGGVVFGGAFFSYQKGGQPILNNINFEAKPGERIAIVGESGVGKSTLVDLISGYYFPDRGSVLIDGHNIRNFDLLELRSKIAVVPQEVILFNDTVRYNIAYGNFGASDEEIEKATKLAHADVFIKKFSRGYSQIVGERGVKLSVGQKQRIAIARAVLRNPKILILDEPTSALDAKSERLIQDGLEKLMRGRTTFIIAHRLSTVRDADKILVLHNGTITESGSHKELLQKGGIYSKLYKLQFGLD